MLRVLAAALTLVAGVALGLAATTASLRGQPPFGAVHSGGWTAWPDAGTSGADPYARAVFARDGRLPLPTAAGLRFLAELDDAGAPLEGRCDYEIAGPVPTAQYWTLTVFDPAGRRQVGPEGRDGFTSAEIVRGGDGRFVIVLARQARPGNWLPLRGEGRFTAMLSLYDSPLGVALQSGAAPAMPSIVRTTCR